MTDKRMIYIVTHGDYSDYRIKAVYDNEPDANAHVARWGGDVEPWELNPYQNVLHEGYGFYRVVMLRNGDVVEVASVTEEGDFGGPPMEMEADDPLIYTLGAEHIPFRAYALTWGQYFEETWPGEHTWSPDDVTATIARNLARPVVMRVQFVAKDETHAIKIANERRGMYIATERWPADPPRGKSGAVDQVALRDAHR